MGIIPVPVIMMIVIILAANFVLNSSYIGRYVYAIGGNEEAARLAGVAVDKIKIDFMQPAVFWQELPALS